MAELNYTGLVYLLNEKDFSIIEILKTGKVHGRNLNITEAMLDDFISNFNSGVYGTEVQVNLGHHREGEAAGWIKKLIKEGDRLLAQVEWTPLGKEKIKSKQFRFTSSELALSHPHHETGDAVKNVLIGVALTNVPAVKGLDPVALSEQAKLFLNSQNTMSDLNKLYKKLSAKDSISDVELKAFQMLAEEVEGEEEKAEAATQSAELEKKVEEPAEEEKEEGAEEEEKKEEEEGEEEKKELSQKSKFVRLSEFKKEQAKTVQLQEQLDRKDLSAKVESEMLISQDVNVGIADKKDVSGVVDFAISLSESQREAFFNIVGNLQAVTLSTIGSTNAVKVVELSDKNIVDRTNELLTKAKQDGVELSARDAQDMAIEELSK